MIDNLISARLVLANGSVVTVSETEHGDLFWALRGAGHNFGIVTEITYKIYDVPADESWAYETYIFKGNEVEAFYGLENELSSNEERRLKVLMFSFFAWNTDVDTEGVSFPNQASFSFADCYSLSYSPSSSTMALPPTLKNSSLHSVPSPLLSQSSPELQLFPR